MGKRGPCWRCHAYHSARTNDYHSPIPPWLEPITQIIPETIWGLLKATVSTLERLFALPAFHYAPWSELDLTAITLRYYTGNARQESTDAPLAGLKQRALQRQSPIDEIHELHTGIIISTSRVQSMMHCTTGSWSDGVGRARGVTANKRFEVLCASRSPRYGTYPRVLVFYPVRTKHHLSLWARVSYQRLT